MFGINSYIIRMLCEDPWYGGAGCSIQEVMQMTPDQVWFRICDKDVLKGGKGKPKIKTVSMVEALSLLSKSGKIKGRTEDGKPIELPLSLGKSVARIIKERVAKQKES